MKVYIGMRSCTMPLMTLKKKGMYVMKVITTWVLTSVLACVDRHRWIDSYLSNIKHPPQDERFALSQQPHKAKIFSVYTNQDTMRYSFRSHTLTNNRCRTVHARSLSLRNHCPEAHQSISNWYMLPKLCTNTQLNYRSFD